MKDTLEPKALTKAIWKFQERTGGFGPDNDESITSAIIRAYLGALSSPVQVKGPEPVATVHVFESSMCNGRKVGRVRDWDKFIKSLPVGEHALYTASSLSPSGEAEPRAASEFDHTTIDYVLKYGGRCRECADHHGLCPNGLPCDVDGAKTAIRWVLKALNYGIANGFVPAPVSLLESSEIPSENGTIR